MTIQQKPAKKSKLKTWVIALICLIVLAGGAFTWYWFNKPLFYAYYYNAFYNPFKPGDKMYVNEWMVDKNSAKDYSRYNLSLYRMVRPLNGDEVDQMNVSMADKILIKKDLSSKKSYMIECGWAVSTDTLCKYKSAFVGTYSESKIANVKIGDNNYFNGVFFAVHPIRKALIRENFTEPPSGYAYDDTLPFYLGVRSVKRQDSKSFREVK
ncbi:MAG: hypothetical protein V4560_18315 [Bacteroidota bacterium]